MLSLGGSSRCWRTNAFLQSLRIFMVEWTQPPKRGCRIPLALSQRLPAGKRWTCGPCTPIWRPTGGLMIEISSLSVCAHLYGGTDIAWDGIEWPCTRLRSRIWNPLGLYAGFLYLKGSTKTGTHSDFLTGGGTRPFTVSAKDEA